MKFSVIVPVYGVEKYLRQCVDSILTQTNWDFELILVDDRSPDRCPAICDEYAVRDDRVKVIHKPVNQGLGEARNTGMEAALGEYIVFIDSDDYVRADMLETISSAADGTQMVIYGMTRAYENKDGEISWREDLFHSAVSTDCEREVGELFIGLNGAGIFPYVCNKAYKRDFLIDCGTKFERTKLIEDFLFNINVFSKARFINVISDCFYTYRKPAHQTLASAYSPDFFDFVKRKYTLETEFLGKMGVDSKDNLQFVAAVFVKHLLSVFMRNRARSANLSAARQRELIREVLNDPMSERILAEYEPAGMKMKVIAGIMKKKMITACYVVAALADFAQSRLQRLFKRLLRK